MFNIFPTLQILLPNTYDSRNQQESKSGIWSHNFRQDLELLGCGFSKFHSLFIYLGFYVTFNTVQVISRRVVGRAEETSTHSSLGFCTVNCRPTASNYQLSHLRPCGDRTPASEVGGESVTILPPWPPVSFIHINN